MLQSEAPFPFVSAKAYLVPTGEALRILRRNLDGTVLVGRTGIRPHHRRASDDFTVPLDQLRGTVVEACEAGLVKPPKARAPRRAKAAGQ